MKNVAYFLSLCAIGTLMVVLAVAPLKFFLSNKEAGAVVSSDFTTIATGAGMIIGYVAYLLVVFFLLGLAAMKIPLCRRAVRWYAMERSRERLRKSGRASEVPAETVQSD